LKIKIIYRYKWGYFMTDVSRVARAKRWTKRAYTLLALFAVSLVVGSFLSSGGHIDAAYARPFWLFYFIWGIVAILGMLVCSVRSLNLVADPNPHAKYLVSVSILLGAIFIFIVLAVRQATQM
jgi:cytochrome bd-type quinol oxidase subunit 2